MLLRHNDRIQHIDLKSGKRCVSGGVQESTEVDDRVINHCNHLHSAATTVEFSKDTHAAAHLFNLGPLSSQYPPQTHDQLLQLDHATSCLVSPMAAEVHLWRQRMSLKAGGAQELRGVLASRCIGYHVVGKQQKTFAIRISYAKWLFPGFVGSISAGVFSGGVEECPPDLMPLIVNIEAWENQWQILFN